MLVRAYLNVKPELEHTGQESYVDRLQRGGQDGVPEVRYFPVGEAGVLDDDTAASAGGRSRRRWRRGEGGAGSGGGAGQEDNATGW